ncbi:hypothetical protein [Fluviispira multicolorata]|uniref:Uncharacterized protein n=1 Tax=Fluviispira multicolorata TaxID=2654512 RepID=A0A833N522_9BACT|nr:hypothetical protein [Fluviispira multicolorata]KAB8033412.1 hypothetical protein GCL57_01545 [Fluviispira multicolorata]
MNAIRTSYSQYLTGRKLEKGITKEIVLQECVNEVNEYIVKGRIQNKNIKEVLKICICKKTDDKKIFSPFFLKNISELNKNESAFFKKVFPRSLQKFLAFLFLSFESNRNTFIKPKESLLNIKLLNIKAFDFCKEKLFKTFSYKNNLEKPTLIFNTALM